MRTSRDRQLHSTEFAFTDDNIQLAAYKAKPSKAVLILSSQHCSPDISNHPARKPEVIMDYNCKKGGTDLMDQPYSLLFDSSTSRDVGMSLFSVTCQISQA